MSENKNNIDRDIAVIGMACLFPGAQNLSEFWQNILNKKDCITDIPETHWSIKDYWSTDPKDPDKTYCKRGGFLPFVEFDPLEYGIGPRDIEVIDTAQLLGMKVAKETLRDAGYLDRDFNRDRTCCIVGSTCITELATPLNMRLSYPTIDKLMTSHGIPEPTRQSIIAQYAKSYPIWQENSFPGVLGNVVSGRIANFLNLGGTNCVIDAACASAFGAVKMATDALITGSCDMAITGGIDTENNIFMYLCFSKTPAFSKLGESRPFDVNSDGILIAEGIGLLAMKRLKDAIRDKDRIYCVMRSMGSSSDGKAQSIYQPVSEGQAKSVRQAYEMASVSPREIELVEAHGTGTIVGDAKEIFGLHSVYRPDEKNQSWCAVGSVKSQIGHTKASAGIAGFIKSALSVYYGVLPPTINITKPNPKLELENSAFYLNTTPRPWAKEDSSPRRAAASAFGFGGTNFHAVLEEFNPEKQTDYTFHQQLLPFYAETQKGLIDSLQSAKEIISQAHDFREACNYLRHLPSSGKLCICLIASDSKDFIKKAENAVLHLTNSASLEIFKDGIYFAAQSPLKNSKLARVFSGQGSQYPGMGRGLLFAFPKYITILDRMEKFRKSHNQNRLSELVWPKAVFTKEEEDLQTKTLTQTENAQPAIGFHNLLTHEILENMGIAADFNAGHSYGELSALYAGKMISFENYLRLTSARGEVMGECARNSEGTMLAVLEKIETIESVLSEFNSAKKASLELANYNAPTQGVVSGKKSQIEDFCIFLSEKKLNFRKIEVGAAFHTILMEPAVKTFAKTVSQVSFAPAKTIVYSNKTTHAYNEKEAADLLSSQLRSPVRYIEMIENLYAQGVRIFVETGPGNIQCGLISRILDKREHLVLPTDPGKNNPEDISLFLQTCARLIALGKINFNPFAFSVKVEKFDKKRKNSPATIQLNGANYLTKATREAVNQPPLHPLPKQEPVKIEVPVVKTVEVVKEVFVSSDNLQTENKSVSLPPSSPVGTFNPIVSRIKRECSSGEKRERGAQKRRTMQDNSFTELDELHEYRMRLLDVHEQFLDMQSDATRLYEKLLLGTNDSVQRQPVQKLAVSRVAKVSQPVAQSKSVQTPTPSGFAVTEKVSAPALMPGAILTPTPVQTPSEPVQKTGSLLSSMFEKSQASQIQTTVAQAPVIKSGGNVAAFLMDTIAEKTGFPREMIEESMDLENDLAVDSIRRVEILGSVQEKFPQAPQIGPAQMGVLRTIGDIIQYLESAGSSTPSASTTPILSIVRPVQATSSSANSQIENFLIETVAEKTGFPKDMITADLNLENDLAVDSIRRVEILGAVQEKFPQAPQIGPAQMGVLSTVGQIAAFLSGSDSSDSQLTPSTDVSAVISSGSQIQSALMEIIAQKTGFPLEMLTPEMDLENDLAVDSIRRVEIMGAFQERFPQAPEVGPNQMGVLRTIHDLVSYLSSEKKNSPLMV